MSAPAKPAPATKPGILDIIDSIRKCIVSILLLVLSAIILVVFVKNAARKELLVKPFRISGSLQSKGYSAEILTSMFIDRIRNIQEMGSSLYHDNKIIIPSWENKVDDISIAFNNSAFAEVKSLLMYFGNARSKYASGQVTEIDSNLSMQFSVADYTVSATGTQDMNELLTATAEKALRNIDPYTLATYFLKTRKYDECLELVQLLLNDDDTTNDGLALHLRGLAYLNGGDTATAREAFLQALPLIKTPWVTCNNLGVIYTYQEKHDSARLMFNQAFTLQPKTAMANLNFANFLYREYSVHGDAKKLDSAITYFKKAIEQEPKQSKLYLAILPAIYDKGDMAAFDAYRVKLYEMDIENRLWMYIQLSLIMRQKKNTEKYNEYYSRAVALCKGDSTQIVQLNHFFPDRK